MAGMLDLGDVLELVNHSFNNRPFAEQYAVDPFHRQVVFGVGLQFGDKLHPQGLAEEIDQWFRNIAFIAKDLPK